MPVPILAVVITVSDACFRREREDTSGTILRQLLEEAGATVLETRVVSDDLEGIVEALNEFAGRDDVNLIITTGGTGLGPRDNTPEATLQVLERQAPGLAEAMRAESLRHTPMGMISRGVCGVCSDALIINLPGSPKAVRESIAVIQPLLNHATALLAGDTRH